MRRPSKHDRWAPRRDRRRDERRTDASAFLDAAATLILRDRPVKDCSEVEKIGWRVAERLQVVFRADANPDNAAVLRRSLAEFGAPGPTRRRTWCARAIAEWAAHWRQPVWQESSETRERCLSGLIRELAWHDRAFDVLAFEHEALAAQLDAWHPSPAGRKGAKSAERILAEIIVMLLDAQGALNLAAKPGRDDEDEIERIRTVIARDVAAFRVARDAAIAENVTGGAAARAQTFASDQLASLDAVAAAAAHQINNPLTSLVANLDVAIADLSAHECDGAGAPLGLGGTERALECLRNASEAAARIRHVVGDLRLFSRVEQEQQGAVDLRAVLDSSIRLAAGEIDRRAHLVKDYAALPRVDGTELRLGQVFLNLLINAAQAIPEGQAEEHEIRVSTRCEAADHIVVEVSDTGHGIPSENIGRIFDPFFTTKPAGEGTGLGLAICQKIVAESGGRIDVQSETGKGSVFRVTLRRCQDA